MKKVFKLGCLGFIGLILLVVIAGMFGSGEESVETSPTSSSEPSEAETKEEAKEEVKTFKIGEVVKVGDVEFKVNGTSKATNVGGEYGVDSMGEFLVVSVSVTNRGNESLLVDSTFFNIIVDGKEYEADSTATIYGNENADFFLSDINPDLSLEGNVVFDLPIDVHSKALTLNVQTGFFGTEQGQISLQ